MSHLRPYPWDPVWYTTTRSPDGGLLLSPWWIAAIVAAGVIILVLICVFGMYLCRPRPGWRADGGTVSARDVCFDAERWLACCVVLHWPRREQPYRTRRQRNVYSGSIDRPIRSGESVLSGYSASRISDDQSYYDDEPRVIVHDQYYVQR